MKEEGRHVKEETRRKEREGRNVKESESQDGN
jgi:hypothetical protein